MKLSPLHFQLLIFVIQKTLYTKNHRFTFKVLILCPKTSVEFIESLSIKAIKVAKILT
jgi:hypothetical protein